MFRRKTDQPTIDVSRLSSLISAGVEFLVEVHVFILSLDLAVVKLNS